VLQITIFSISQPQTDNGIGSKNNIITVKKSDFEVFDALDIDSSTGSTDHSGNSEILMYFQPLKLYNIFRVAFHRLWSGNSNSPLSRKDNPTHTSSPSASSHLEQRHTHVGKCFSVQQNQS